MPATLMLASTGDDAESMASTFSPSPRVFGHAPQAEIERLSANDLMELATETPSAPMQMVAVLRLDRPVAATDVRAALATRVAAVPRLRQRLISAPPGCGRPFWMDEPGFRIDRHLAVQRCEPPGDEDALMRVAAQASVSRLPRDRPLWRLILVADLADGGSALVLAVHHVLADGIGGLAALAQLVDSGTPAYDATFPLPVPPTRFLLIDAVRTRIRRVRRAPGALTRLRYAATELRFGHSRKAAAPPAAPCSLNRPIGPRRQLATAKADLAALAKTAHRHHATINDVLLTAVSGGLSGCSTPAVRQLTTSWSRCRSQLGERRARNSSATRLG
jgi:diacylglycerol O-acyltransferase / wax synthase